MRLSLKQKPAGQPAVNDEINRQNRNDNSVNESVRSHSPPNVLEVKSEVESPRATETVRPRGARLRSSSEPLIDLGDLEPTPRTDHTDQTYTKAKPAETYGEYNNSLDKLNQSSTDLQGELMRLSLKQKPAGQPAVNDEINRQNRNDNSVNESVRSHLPPNVLEVKSEVESPRATETVRPRVNDEINRQNRNAGSVYYNPNQFVPVSGGTGMVPTHQQYGSYLMDPTPGQMGQIPPQQITPPYQQSPPHMYPQTVPMYGQPFTQQNIIIQQSQLYPTMYAIQQPSRNHSINLTHILPRPAGPATSSNPNQFVPVPGGTGMVPTPQQYGSYLMGPTPGQMDQIPPQQISQVSETSQARGEETESGVQDTSVVGFGQDESMLDQIQRTEIEMQKLKAKILRKREAERREEKPKQKPWPKSMFVRAGPGANLHDGLEKSASTENLSARNLTLPSSRGSNDGLEKSASTENLSARNLTLPSSRGSNSAACFFSPDPVRRNRSRIPRSKHLPPQAPFRTMRKAVSCNMLDQKPAGAGDGKSLAFGGLTHRRPPSLNLYRKGAEVPVGDDYTGPKLFVTPIKSNRHKIIHAIGQYCLAGSCNTDQRNKVLEEIAKSNAKHFLILFRDASCGYRGLYGFDLDTENTFKLVGVGPRTISNIMIKRYYKYNSGANSFSEVSSTKHISVLIDALVLQNCLETSKSSSQGILIAVTICNNQNEC